MKWLALSLAPVLDAAALGLCLVRDQSEKSSIFLDTWLELHIAVLAAFAVMSVLYVVVTYLEENH